MAKGNMILGYLRGAIGDIVFYRSKGQQMARARNRNPNNPRTVSQIETRARWAQLAKFVRMSEPKFFEDAFEYKKISESDYNAFMRINFARALMISKTASLNTAYPAAGGPWQMSRGSLPQVKMWTEWADVLLDSPFWELCSSDSVITIPAAGARTIAWLTNTLISLAPSTWRIGDTITFVIVSYNLNGEPTATPTESDYSWQFIYRQITLNSNDTRLLVNVIGTELRVNTIDDGKRLGYSYGQAGTAQAEWEEASRAVTVIHSRKTSKGLQVSNSELFGNTNYQLNWAYMANSTTYKSAVLADWQAAEGAILQGSEEISGLDPYLLSTVGADFLTADRSVVANVNETNIVNAGVITEWDTTHGNATILSIHFDGNQNPNYDIQQIDPTKFVITGIDCTYNSRESEYSSIITQVAFTIPTQSTIPTTPINVMYDGRLIMTITFS